MVEMVAAEAMYRPVTATEAINKKQDIIEMKNNNTNIQYKVVPIKGS
jgi:hypothetical protein